MYYESDFSFNNFLEALERLNVYLDTTMMHNKWAFTGMYIY